MTILIATLSVSLIQTSCRGSDSASSSDSGSAYSKTLDGVTISFTRPSSLSATELLSGDSMISIGSTQVSLTMTVASTYNTSILTSSGYTLSNITLDSNDTYYKQTTGSESGLQLHTYVANVGGTEKSVMFIYGSSETSSSNANAIMNTVEFN